MKKKILSLLVALCLVFSSLPAVFAGEESGSVNIVVKNLNQKEKDTFTSFDEAYDYYTKGNPDDKIPVFQWSWAEEDVALIELQNNDSMTFAFEQEEGQDAAKAFEITHDTCITLRTAIARTPEAVKEVTITVDTPIVVKSGHYLILRSQGMGYDNEYSTVKLNCSITVEDGATLLLDAPNITTHPTGPRDIYVGPEKGPAIVAENGATVRLGGVILQPNKDNESPFIQAEGATVIVQAGNSVDTAKGTRPTGELPAVDNTWYHSNASAQTAGAPVIAATDGAEVQLLGGNIVSTGTNPAITVDGSSSIKIDMENEAWTNKHGQGIKSQGESAPAISIASNGALELGDYAPATSENNELQAINLAAGVTVKKGELTVRTAEDESGDNYVDNYGNLVLAKGAVVGEETPMASAVILKNGTIIQGSEDVAPEVTYSEGEDGVVTTTVTVPAGGSVTTAEGTKTTMPNGGSASSDGSNTSVTPNQVAIDSITLDRSSMTLYSNTTPNTYTLTAVVTPENATDKTVSWASDNPSAATVDANGKVTAVADGTAVITATAGEKTASCTVTVTTYSSGSYYPSVPTVQKPTIEADANATVTLDSTGTTATITVADGYELADVTVNGVSKGAVTTLTGLKTGDKVVVTTRKADSAGDDAALIEAVKNTRLVARSMYATAPSGKKSIKVYWFNKDGSELDFDGYEVYRSLKKNSGYGKTPIFKTTKERYFNTAIKKGTKYYYKVRGYKVINGEKVYTEYSLKAWRTAK